MPVFEDTPEERDFRLAVKRFVARELTPHREDGTRTELYPVKYGEKWATRVYCAHVSRKSTADQVSISNTLSSLTRNLLKAMPCAGFMLRPKTVLRARNRP